MPKIIEMEKQGGTFKARKPSKALAIVTGLGALASGSAMAALPVGATDAFASINTDAQAMIDQGWPIVLTITIGFVLFKLFRRTIGSAT